jgi:hypothetical protein
MADKNSKFVYVTGPCESDNEITKRRNKEQLEFVCRRVLVANHIPICPILFYGEFPKDPRLYSNSGWWVEKVFRPLMEICTYFCLITTRIDHSNERIMMEKSLWAEVGSGKIIVEEKILPFLLGDDDGL